MPTGSKLQDSRCNVDCVFYYCIVGNEVSCRGGGLGVVADGTRDLGGCALCCDDLGSSSVWHPVAFGSLLLDLVTYNLYAEVEEVGRGCRVVPYGRAVVPANCCDPYDLPPEPASC